MDGGLVNPVPVSMCRALGADLVIAIDLSWGKLGPYRERGRAKDADPVVAPREVPGWIGKLREGWLRKQSDAVAEESVSIPSIFQVFTKARDAGMLRMNMAAPSNFGMALVALGVVLLIAGIVYHVSFMRGLRATRKAMVEAGLVHGESGYPLSYTLLTAIILLMIGVFAIVSMVFDVARG